MNKLYKCALGLLTAFTLSFACFSSAVDYVVLDCTHGDCTLRNEYITSKSFTKYGIYCIVPQISTNNCPNGECASISVNGTNYKMGGRENMYCVLGDDITINSNGNWNFQYYYIQMNYEGLKQFYPDYTSLQCQTEYNLIPVNDVNPNYCNLNFGMIDPRECPTTEGTGAISWTPRFINDQQYPGTNLLNINIPEDIAHTVIYNEEETIVNVEGYNADENYINGILQNEKLTPTNKDIEEMITGFMINYFPYLALAIVFLYLARKIFKLFK